jgi:hypothetical protein
MGLFFKTASANRGRDANRLHPRVANAGEKLHGVDAKLEYWPTMYGRYDATHDQDETRLR